MKHLNLGFIGFGLIGGSIAKSLKKRGADIRVLVYSRRKNPDLFVGVEDRIIDEIVYEIDDSFTDCDMIFLCAPVNKIIDLLPSVAKKASPNCIITDVGSVKGAVCKAAAELGLASRFIGGHPMAGSEKTGYASATDNLLENAFYLLTPSKENSPEDISLLKELVEATGATCVILDPERHDRITAAISHVPHLVAAALVNLVRKHDDEEQTMKTFAAGGFRDITRIASSSPQMWEEICMTNRDAIEDYLEEMESILREYRQVIHDNQGEQIFDAFEQAGEYRNSLPIRKKGLFPSVHELFINLDDRPGAIADVASLLSDAGISICNIGIIHNREFADGVLRVEMYNAEDKLSAALLLRTNHYELPERA
ncbi:MAG: prephenate dehydrogenase [Eubacterium sp.]|nr:prephenate dehydrogenase [Eubacterium sp.]